LASDSIPTWRDFITCVDLSEQVCRVASCRQPLPSRRTAYCSNAHARQFQRDHVWLIARQVARRRARWSCERCGFKPSAARKDPATRREYTRAELRLEVNHIRPLTGSYRGVTCHNHQSNLEVLCHRCHLEATKGQRLQRSLRRR